MTHLRSHSQDVLSLDSNLCALSHLVTASDLTLHLVNSQKVEGAWGWEAGKSVQKQLSRGKEVQRAGARPQACRGLTLYWCEKTFQHPYSLPPPQTATLGCPLPAGGYSLAPRRKPTGLRRGAFWEEPSRIAPFEEDKECVKCLRSLYSLRVSISSAGWSLTLTVCRAPCASLGGRRLQPSGPR